MNNNAPWIVLAPMDGITDAPMRMVQSRLGKFTFCVSEFIRVTDHPLPSKVFAREIPELQNPTGLPVQVQILGGQPEWMAKSALNAVNAGAWGIDINFGCPAPTVNRNDGGATLLKSSGRIYDIVRAVRAAVPEEIPVSAKLRLGWDSLDPITENACAVQEAGASWITIHGRTKCAGYQPPIYWEPIGKARSALAIPVVANGDIWTIEDFRRCREITGCDRFMIGRGALANPLLSWQVALELGNSERPPDGVTWTQWFEALVEATAHYGMTANRSLLRLKQWASIAHKFGEFQGFDQVKHCDTLSDFLSRVRDLGQGVPSK